MKGLTHMSETIDQIGNLWPLVSGIVTAIFIAVLSIARSQWRDDQQEKTIQYMQREHHECKINTQRTLSDIHGRVSKIEGKLDTAIELIKRGNGERNG